MYGSDATIQSVEEYLESLPPEKRSELEKVREVILRNLPEGYQEAFAWGMITYQVPLERYSDTYNGKPLMYAALTAQKKHHSLYLTGIYLSEEDRENFEQAYRNTGKRFDASKSCVRFRTTDDLPLDLIAKEIASLDVPAFIEKTEQVLSKPRKRRSKSK